MTFRNKKTGGLYTLSLYNKRENKVTLTPRVWIVDIYLTVDEFLNEYEFLALDK